MLPPLCVLRDSSSCSGRPDHTCMSPAMPALLRYRYAAIACTSRLFFGVLDPHISTARAVPAVDLPRVCTRNLAKAQLNKAPRSEIVLTSRALVSAPGTNARLISSVTPRNMCTMSQTMDDIYLFKLRSAFWIGKSVGKDECQATPPGHRRHTICAMRGGSIHVCGGITAPFMKLYTGVQEHDVHPACGSGAGNRMLPKHRSQSLSPVLSIPSSNEVEP